MYKQLNYLRKKYKFQYTYIHNIYIHNILYIISIIALFFNNEVFNLELIIFFLKKKYWSDYSIDFE